MRDRAEMWDRVELFGGCEGQGGDVGKQIRFFDLVVVSGRAEIWERVDLFGGC
jgi:hypothetical protein